MDLETLDREKSKGQFKIWSSLKSGNRKVTSKEMLSRSNLRGGDKKKKDKKKNQMNQFEETLPKNLNYITDSSTLNLALA